MLHESGKDAYQPLWNLRKLGCFQESLLWELQLLLPKCKPISEWFLFDTEDQAGNRLMAKLPWAPRDLLEYLCLFTIFVENDQWKTFDNPWQSPNFVASRGWHQLRRIGELLHLAFARCSVLSWKWNVASADAPTGWIGWSNANALIPLLHDFLGQDLLIANLHQPTSPSAKAARWSSCCVGPVAAVGIVATSIRIVATSIGVIAIAAVAIISGIRILACDGRWCEMPAGIQSRTHKSIQILCCHFSFKQNISTKTQNYMRGLVQCLGGLHLSLKKCQNCGWNIWHGQPSVAMPHLLQVAIQQWEAKISELSQILFSSCNESWVTMMSKAFLMKGCAGLPQCAITLGHCQDAWG